MAEKTFPKQIYLNPFDGGLGDNGEVYADTNINHLVEVHGVDYAIGVYELKEIRTVRSDVRLVKARPTKGGKRR